MRYETFCWDSLETNDPRLSPLLELTCMLLFLVRSFASHVLLFCAFYSLRYRQCFFQGVCTFNLFIENASVKCYHTVQFAFLFYGDLF